MSLCFLFVVSDASRENLLMSAPSSLNVLINPQALNQAAASQQCGNVIYMIRGAKNENGSSQIVIQNTQELLNLLNKNHSKFAITQNLTESIVERSDAGALNELKIETKPSDNVNNHLNLQHLSKDSRIVIKTLDKSHSFLVVRNGSRGSSVETRAAEKEDLSKASQAYEHVKKSNDSSEVQKYIPIGSGKFFFFYFFHLLFSTTTSSTSLKNHSLCKLFMRLISEQFFIVAQFFEAFPCVFSIKELFPSQDESET